MGGVARPRTGHRISAIVATIALVVTAGLVWATWVAYEDNEDRLLQERTAEAAAVLTATIPSVQLPLATVAGLPRVVEEADVALFERAIGPYLGEGATFVSASLWPVDGAVPVVVLGEPPVLATRTPAEVGALFGRATRSGQIAPLDLLTLDPPRIGYAQASPGGPAPYIVYAEQVLPSDRTAAAQPGAAFADLDYALYLGTEEAGDHLVFASRTDLPLDGRHDAATIPFGDSSLLLVMAPTDDLSGDLLGALPWVLLVAGVLLTAGGVVLTELLQRRRAHAEALAVDNARLYDEQRGAFQMLQRNLLPRRLPSDERLEIGVRYAPGVAGTDVGGDWYDVVQVDGALILVVGDVSGRGMAAAAVMASARFAIRTLAAQGLGPAEVLATVNGLDADERAGHFATVLCGRLDPATGALELATAGHPPALLLTGRGARFVDVPVGPPVGATATARYSSATVSVPRGATLLLVTDGLFERRGEGIDVGLERLRTVAQAAADEPLEALLDTLVEELMGGQAPDDAAILALRRTRSPRRRRAAATPSGDGARGRRRGSGSH